MDIQTRLAQRELGQIPVSIGTSLALEGAAGIIEEAPVNPAPIVTHSPQELWINLRTLFRNFYNSIERDLKNAILPADVVPLLLEEIEVINAAVNKISEFKTKPVFYYCTLNSMSMEFPKAKLKQAKTPLQQQYVEIERRVCWEIVQALGSDSVRVFDIHLKGRWPGSYILTHAPVDLLSHRYFADLRLLESHTGKIKGRAQWNTKLTGGKGYERIPFNRFTLQLFGDDSTYFYAMSIKLKRFVLDLAQRRRWSPVVSKEKILQDLKFERDPVMEQFARDLFATKHR